MASGDDGYPRPGDSTPPPEPPMGGPAREADARPTDPPPGGGGPSPVPYGGRYDRPGEPYGAGQAQDRPYGAEPGAGGAAHGPAAQPYGPAAQPYGGPGTGHAPDGPGGPGGPQWAGWAGGAPGPTPPQPELWRLPTQPSPPRRRNWKAPVIAVVAAFAVAGGTFAFLTVRGEEPAPVTSATTAAAAASPAVSASSAPPELDVCSLLNPDETERLVPGADIDARTDDNRDDTIVSYVNWSCTWINRNISYKDVIRSREIDIYVSQYEAVGNTTAVKSARIQYDGTLRQYKYQAGVSNKERYYSKPRQFTGIGDEAVAQYHWTREPGRYWYSYGEGIGRIKNVVFRVKYQASQRHKESDIWSTETVQSVTEENALREVRGLLAQLATSIGEWQAGRPLPYRVRPKPSPSPSPSPTLIPLPSPCTDVESLAAKLVPDTKGAAARVGQDGALVTQCQWWNDKLPLGQGKVRWRNLRVNVYAFPDADSARYYLIDKRGKAKASANGGFGGIYWGKIEKLRGYGQDAFGQAIKQQTSTAQANRYDIYALDGKNVVWVMFSGSDRPENTPINSTDSVLMDPKEAAAGAKSIMRAVLDAL